MDSADFQTEFQATTAMMQRLQRYAELLAEWQARINLVGPKTLDDVWGRHFADSAQLLPLVPGLPSPLWVDIGTGAGFPGMVIAILSDMPVVLIESIHKKVRFLQTARAELELNDQVKICHGRAEDIRPLQASVVSARAVAPLRRLVPLAQRHLRPAGMMIFPKGRSWAEEVADIKKHIHLDLQAIPSKTDSEARILCLRRRKRG